MKCSYCGNHLEKEAQFCPECGTILGADIDDNYEDFDTQILEQEKNVFSAPLVNQPSEEAVETVAQTTEVIEEEPQINEPIVEAEPVQTGETEVLDQVFSVQEEVVAPKKDKKKDRKNKKNKKNQAIAIEKYEEAFEPQEAFSNSADIKEEDIPAQPEEATDIFSFSDDKEEISTEESGQTEILVAPEDTYNVFQTLPEQEEEIEDEQDQFQTTFETYEEPAKKKKKPLAAVIVAILIAAVCAAFAMNYDTIISVLPDTETTEETVDADVSVDMSEETTEETSEETTEEITEETTEETSEEETTEEETTQTTTATTAAVTTTAATTAATTTAATTTTAAATTTTQSSTTTTAAATTTTTTTTASSSTTTDPFGIGDATVVKPSSSVSAYTVYVQSSGLMITSEPSSSGERIIYVEKGADLTVSGEQDGYLYVYSNRIGVYGWISESSVATTRPAEETTASTSGVEQPDTVYDDYITMYISPSVGLNLRSGPSTSYDVIKNIQQNYQVQVVGYNSDDPSWVYVIDTTFGVTGWVSLEYLSTSEVR